MKKKNGQNDLAGMKSDTTGTGVGFLYSTVFCLIG